MFEFLVDVWAYQLPGKWGCIAQKDQVLGSWKQKFIRLHADDWESKLWTSDQRDVYFSPNVFSEKNRHNSNACASRLLYADLDEVDPRELKWAPTVWWETSKGRYQCIWVLEKYLPIKSHEQLNQRMTYFCHADKNGWDLSQVLRVPGTVNTKWEQKWVIPEAHWDEDVVYDARELWEKLRHVPVVKSSGGTINLADSGKAAKLMKRVSKPTQMKLRRKHARDRSAHVHHVALLLAEEGFSRGEALTLLLTSPVGQDKYGGRYRDEAERVIGKIDWPKKKRARQEVQSSASTNGHVKVEPDSMWKFLWKNIEPPSWAVDDVWIKHAKGLIAGESKAYKSLIAMDLAVSIASGRSFLGVFKVPKDARGPVLYIQEENQPGFIQDRMRRILYHKGLILRKDLLPSRVLKRIHVTNLAGFKCTDDEWLEWLFDQCEKLKPSLILLDPWYKFAVGVPENDNTAVGEQLDRLDSLHQQLSRRSGLIIVHHYKKKDVANPLHSGDIDRISGAGAFGRWYESVLAIEKKGEDEGVKVHAHHRVAKGMSMDLDFEIGGVSEDEERPYYRPLVKRRGEEKARGRRDIVREMVAEEDTVTVIQIMQTLGVENRKKMMRDLRDWGYEIQSQGRGKSGIVSRS